MFRLDSPAHRPSSYFFQVRLPFEFRLSPNRKLNSNQTQCSSTESKPVNATKETRSEKAGL